MNHTQQNKYNRTKWAVFAAATLGYGLFYVCRLSLNVVKKPIVDAGYPYRNRVRNHRFRPILYLCNPVNL